MNWIKTEDELPKLYAPVLADWMGTTFLTPDGWDGGLPPQRWAYVVDTIRDENQVSISEWGAHTFGVAKDPALLVGRALEEFAELCFLLLTPEVGKKFREVVDSLKCRMRTPATPKPTIEDMGEDLSGELADTLVVLFQAAEGYGIDLLGAVDAKMKVNRARKWNTDKDGMGQHQD